MTKYRNFDTFVEEKRKEAITYTLFGKQRYAPSTLRYDAVLELQRLARRNKDESVTDDEAFNVFELFIGSETLDELRQHTDFTVDLAAELVKWLLDQYGMSFDGPKVTQKAE